MHITRIDDKKPSISGFIALLLLHRGFFGRALEEERDPMQSRFAPSVHATYTSAWRSILSLQHAYSLHPELTQRFGLLWSNAFSASVRCTFQCPSLTHRVIDISVSPCNLRNTFLICFRGLRRLKSSIFTIQICCGRVLPGFKCIGALNVPCNGILPMNILPIASHEAFTRQGCGGL